MLAGRPEGHRADAGGDAAAYAVQGRRELADAVDDVAAHPLGGGLVAVGEEQRELVAAEAGHHVGVAHRAAQDAADGDQQLVAGVVAEAVVDLLEVVEVEQQHRAGRAVASAALEVSLELGVEATPVGQAGEHVVVDEVRQPVLVAPTLGDVDDVDQHDVGLLGPGAPQEAAAQPHVDVLATVVAQHAVRGVGAGDVLEDAGQVVGDRGVVRRGQLGQPHALELVGGQADDPAQRRVDELDAARGVQHRDPVRRVEEQSLALLGGRAGGAGLALHPHHDALHDATQDHRDGDQEEGSPPVLDRVAGRPDQQHGAQDRRPREHARDVQLPPGARDRQPQDGDQDQHGHPRGLSPTRLADEQDEDEGEVGGRRVDPAAQLAPAALDEQTHDGEVDEGRQGQHDPRHVVRRQQHGEQAEPADDAEGAHEAQ